MLIIKGGLICCSNTAFMTHGYQNCHLVQKSFGESDIHTRACTHKDMLPQEVYLL